MRAIEVNNLLQAISADAPCGMNLEYDPAFMELARAAVRKPERQYGNTVIPAEEPDWQDVRRRALELFAHTKDIRVALHLAAAAVRTSGLEGLRDALVLIHSLLERFWDQVHPQLDPMDNNDPTLRMNALAGLNDDEVMLRGVREAYLFTLPNLGILQVRTLLVAHGMLPASTSETSPNASQINSAIATIDSAVRHDLRATVQGALTHAQGICNYLVEKVGADRAPQLDGLTGLLHQVVAALAEPLGREATNAATPPAAQLSAAVTQTGAEIRNRDDVHLWLDKICAYYAVQEPSSPVPLLLRRAQRLVSKGFVEIIRDLTPDAMPQVDLIGGKGAEQ